MKIKITSSIILMVICALILVSTIGLYAADKTKSIEAQCDSYCNKHYGDDDLMFEACYSGCLFGAGQ